MERRRGRAAQVGNWFPLAFLVLLLLAVVGTEIWAIVTSVQSQEANTNRNLLVLSDSQRLAIGSSLVYAVEGDQDLVFTRVLNNQQSAQIVNISVVVVIESAANRKRGPVALTVYCPPLYTSNEIAALAPGAAVTCRATYTLSSLDVAQGNTLFTMSSAEGVALDAQGPMSVSALPGQSALAISNIDSSDIVLAAPVPAGAVSVVTGFCNASTTPVTDLVCTNTNELQLLICGLSSAPSSLAGAIYECTGLGWLFFGNVSTGGNVTTVVGPTGPTGPQGIGIYAATCSGGPPPTTVSSPTYTCNTAFKLNMVLCSVSSTNNNAGVIYQCQCNPSCAWTQVASLTSLPLMVAAGITGQAIINTTSGAWTNIISLSLPVVGTWSCWFSGSFNLVNGEPNTCPVNYGFSQGGPHSPPGGPHEWFFQNQGAPQVTSK